MSKIIETERLILRTLTEDDFEDYCQYAMDPEVMKYIHPVGNKKSAYKSFLGHAGPWNSKQGRWMGLAVVLKLNQQLIGDVGFRYKDKHHGHIEIGYKFSRDYQGKGYGSEAMDAVLQMIVRDWPCHKIVAYCDPRNIASWKLMERFGMVREGYFKEHFNYDGRWQDEVAYGCLVKDLKL